MRITLSENFRAVFYAPYYAAYALGFYAREGVEVELQTAAAPGQAAAALLEGTVDLIWGGPMRVMRMRDQQRDPTLMCFCEVAARDPFFLVGKRKADFQLTDLPQLRFASVSEVPTPWLCLQHDLREHGLDPARLARVSDRTMAENLEALRAGRLDVAQLFEPYVSMAVREGIGDILYAASSRGPTSYTTFLATRDGIARHRDAFAAMTRGICQMRAWLAEHAGAELAQVTAQFYPDVAHEILVNALTRYHQAGIWSCTPEVSPQGFARLGESLRSGGFISALPRYEDCVDASFARAA
jgi:NitT/TauT family transport system substrate-binding protein